MLKKLAALGLVLDVILFAALVALRTRDRERRIRAAGTAILGIVVFAWLLCSEQW
ncbi:hypothetical protein [Streptomyces sp. NPDC005302]|uniref:hypothetical protein n=1 Tax=Streptomyces sp. NPDC005302 TaxID=3154675 RepID=UPI0033BD40FD